MMSRLAAMLCTATLALAGCDDSRCLQLRDSCGLSDNDHCGPSEAVVKRIIDGDTVELDSGEKVRYLGIDTPEKNERGYSEATELNRRLVEGQQVHLEYDVQCKDRYGRLLAFVCADGTMVNEELIREGHAKPLSIKPNVCNKDEFQQIYDDF